MKILFAAALLCACRLACAAPEPVITMAWRDKPPYQYVDEQGVERGFLLERTRLIFSEAGIPASFVREPIKRIWANFGSHTPQYCSNAWYRLPEREALAQYSLPIYRDPPQAVLIAPGARARVRTHMTLSALLADPTLTLGLVDGVSYGPELDARIRAAANKVITRTVKVTDLTHMLAVDRVSFIFLDRDDWNYQRERDPALKNVTRQDFPDLPAGLERYIVCSKDISAETMARLNAAILRVTAADAARDDGRKPAKSKGK